LEPPNTYQGILINNRQRALYHLVRCLNDEMAGKVDSGKATYYIELTDFIRLKAGLCRISDRTTPSSSSEGHNSRADLGRDAVNALEVADAGSRGFAPRRLWPGLLKFERKEAEQLGFRAA